MVLTAAVCQERHVLASLSVLPIQQRIEAGLRAVEQRLERDAALEGRELDAVAGKRRVERIDQRKAAGAGRILDHHRGRARNMASEIFGKHARVQIVAAAGAQTHADGDGAAAIEIGDRLRRDRRGRDQRQRDNRSGDGKQAARHGLAECTTIDMAPIIYRFLRDTEGPRWPTAPFRGPTRRVCRAPFRIFQSGVQHAWSQPDRCRRAGGSIMSSCSCGAAAARPAVSGPVRTVEATARGRNPMGSEQADRACAAGAADPRVPDRFRSEPRRPGARRTGQRSALHLHPQRHATDHERDLSDGGRAAAEDHLHDVRVRHSAPHLHRRPRLAYRSRADIHGLFDRKWLDNGHGRYDTLEVETRNLKGPRTYDTSGLPLHTDNQTVVKERIFLDKSDGDLLHDEITTFDHALTRPWTVDKRYRRERNVVWVENVCNEYNPHVAIHNEIYYLSADGDLMPSKKDQPPPDLKYFRKKP
jgi:hypothetical protein